MNPISFTQIEGNTWSIYLFICPYCSIYQAGLYVSICGVGIQIKYMYMTLQQDDICYNKYPTLEASLAKEKLRWVWYTLVVKHFVLC